MASTQFLELTRQLLYPPNHPNHVVSLYTALLTVRRCLNLEAGANQQGFEGALSIEATCQAWTLLAEIGLMVLGAGLGGDTGPDWARGIAPEVEHAIDKGLKLTLTSKITLRPFWIHLMALHAHLVLWQHHVKFSRHILNNLRGSLTKLDPPSTHYSILLAWHANLLAPVPPSHNSSTATISSTPPAPSHSDISSALQATSDLHVLARQNGPGHELVIQLAIVLRLRTLARAEMWHARPNEDLNAGNSIAALLPRCEATLYLQFNEPANSQAPIPPELPSETLHLQMHTLIISVLYYALVGNAKASSLRLSRLHVLLDATPADIDSVAYLRINLGPTGPPLIVQTTHPRVLFELAFLVSSISKRDLVGRRPRRKIFAEEGLKISDTVGEDMFFPVWASLGDAREVEDRLAKIKADLLCEMAAIAIIRNEFEEANEFLDRVIAHTRTYSIFPFYAARITLHQAHLAHATTQHSRALSCYRAAAYLDSTPSNSAASSSSPSYGGRTGGFVRVAARAGEVGLLLGLRALHRHGGGNSLHKGKARETDDSALDAMAREVVNECKLFPGTLAAVGKVIEAVLSTEIVKAKQRLKSSLDIASASQDNHLRGLIIALTSAHYVHTASGHAKMMLDTAQQVAAGMGAPSVKPGDPSSEQVEETPSLGNAPLGLWVGERYHELYLRHGDNQRAHEQHRVNEALRVAVRALPFRGLKPPDKRSQTDEMQQ